MYLYPSIGSMCNTTLISLSSSERILFLKFIIVWLFIAQSMPNNACYTPDRHLSIRVLTSLRSAHKRTLMDWGLPSFTIPWFMMKYIAYMPSWLLCHFEILSSMRDYPYWHLAHHARVLCSASHVYLYARVAFVLCRISCAGCSTIDPRMVSSKLIFKNMS